MINYHFPETWTVQNLHNKANRYIRRWLSIPISGTVNHLLLKVKQLIIGKDQQMQRLPNELLTTKFRKK